MAKDEDHLDLQALFLLQFLGQSWHPREKWTYTSAAFTQMSASHWEWARSGD